MTMKHGGRRVALAASPALYPMCWVTVSILIGRLRDYVSEHVAWGVKGLHTGEIWQQQIPLPGFFWTEKRLNNIWISSLEAWISEPGFICERSEGEVVGGAFANVVLGRFITPWDLSQHIWSITSYLIFFLFKESARNSKIKEFDTKRRKNQQVNVISSE